MLTPVEWGVLFIAGLGSSVHCLAMCGVFSVGAARGGGSRLGYFLPYSAGRLSAYFSLGLLAGLIGQPLRLLAPFTGAQAAVTLGFGFVMVIGGLHLLGALKLPSSRLGAQPGNLLARVLHAILPPDGPAQALYLGVGNGLLPCPLIYGFLPLAMSTGAALEGGLVMATFGLGTVPALLALALASRGWDSRHPGFHWRPLRWAPGLALLALGLLTAGRAILLYTSTGHAAHFQM